MKNNGVVVNANLLEAIALLRHTQYLAIVDLGTPIPDDIYEIDISLTEGIPSFLETVKAVSGELLFEKFVYAKEIKEYNPGVHTAMLDTLGNHPFEEVTHEEFKKLAARAKCVVRTGEKSPYANVILVGGVDF